jgi:hypothetical protein
MAALRWSGRCPSGREPINDLDLPIGLPLRTSRCAALTNVPAAALMLDPLPNAGTWRR